MRADEFLQLITFSSGIEKY